MGLSRIGAVQWRAVCGIVWIFFWVCVLCSAGAQAQTDSLVVHVRTNKSVYEAWELIQIEVLATNLSSRDMTLEFSTTCHTTFAINGERYNRTCGFAFTYATVPAGTTKVMNDWDEEMQVRLAPGVYEIEGVLIGHRSAKTTILVKPHGPIDLSVSESDFSYRVENVAGGYKVYANVKLRNLSSVGVGAVDGIFRCYSSKGREPKEIRLISRRFRQGESTRSWYKNWYYCPADSSFTMSLEWSTTRPGRYRLEAVVDPEDWIAEVDETNNWASIEIVVGNWPEEGDPVVVDVSTDKAMVAQGEPVVLLVSVSNPSSHTVRIPVASEAPVSYAVAGTLTPSESSGGMSWLVLDPKTTQTWTFTLNLPPGTHSLQGVLLDGHWSKVLQVEVGKEATAVQRASWGRIKATFMR